IFIADATGDTMLGGGGLNPNSFTNDWIQYGLPIPYGNIILPMPDDTNKYVLFHQTGDYNSISTLASTEIFYSVVDISMSGGFGQVISKNNVALSGSFGWGLSACKHGNGRDWWLIALNDSATISYKFLLTPDTIQFINSQNMQVPSHIGFAGQPTFSPDGEKFGYTSGDGFTGPWLMAANLFSFDRCSGDFILDTVINYFDGNPGFGCAFSPNSKYFYFATTEHIYQVDTYAPNIGVTFQTVAINDTFLSAPPVFYTSFHLMYLAANGKIYVSSGSSVKHLHEMNYPDSAGIACDVQLHNVFTNCFFIGVPNHTNYYLGRLVGSPCDTLTGIHDLAAHDFRFSVSPNPNNGNFKIMYLLPQNKSGTLQIFDITGKEIYHQNLPPWSTLQYISLPKIADGVYQCTITSNNQRVNKKLVVVRE
ncbi:MAG: T9SS type A sorting domain-containing protein, partial [Bacteroidetes bacterium]|nr:T9SS type A sorting domain-containing protein [Bacteroidota bacterium]